MPEKIKTPKSGVPKVGDYDKDGAAIYRHVTVPGLYKSEKSQDADAGTKVVEKTVFGSYKLDVFRRDEDGKLRRSRKTRVGSLASRDLLHLDDGQKKVDHRSSGDRLIRSYRQTPDGSKFFEHKRYFLYDNKAVEVDRKTGAHKRTVSFPGYERITRTDAKQNTVLMGKKRFLSSERVVDHKDGTRVIKVKRLGGLVNRSYRPVDDASLDTYGVKAAKGELVSRRLGFHRTSVADGERRSSVELGKNGRLFRHETWTGVNGKRKGFRTKILGIEFGAADKKSRRDANAREINDERLSGKPGETPITRSAAASTRHSPPASRPPSVAVTADRRSIDGASLQPVAADNALVASSVAPPLNPTSIAPSMRSPVGDKTSDDRSNDKAHQPIARSDLTQDRALTDDEFEMSDIDDADIEALIKEAELQAHHAHDYAPTAHAVQPPRSVAPARGADLYDVRSRNDYSR